MTKIRINPNDQRYVGMKIRHEFLNKGAYYYIKYVGKEKLFADLHYDNGAILYDLPILIDSDWEIYEESEEKVTPPFISAFKILDKNQGHHCTGKCTKLEEQMFKSVTNAINKPECCDAHKEKECEHIVWKDGDLKTDTRKCVKCDKLVPVPFWLKVGDVIRDKKVKGRVLKVYNINLNQQFIQLLPLDNSYQENMSFEYCTEDKFKKIKLVSPAIFRNDKKKYPKSKTWFIGEELFLSKEDAIDRYTEDFVDIIWPAKDQFGKEIWYEVEL